MPLTRRNPVRVLGVDEFALFKGHNYATILVDLEARRPVDVLHGREAETVARWLAEHPEVEVLCRDRPPPTPRQPERPLRKRSRSQTSGTCGTTSPRPSQGRWPATMPAPRWSRSRCGTRGGDLGAAAGGDSRRQRVPAPDRRPDS
ncbi:transposase [Streptomyces sp. ASQP_92]|uniref:transposase n=1 Tax=Streptomyces sp. ASQP_92 TaxID=2979116 RepID=UPI0037D9C2BF